MDWFKTFPLSFHFTLSCFRPKSAGGLTVYVSPMRGENYGSDDPRSPEGPSASTGDLNLTINYDATTRTTMFYRDVSGSRGTAFSGNVPRTATELAIHPGVVMEEDMIGEMSQDMNRAKDHHVGLASLKPAERSLPTLGEEDEFDGVSVDSSDEWSECEDQKWGVWSQEELEPFKFDGLKALVQELDKDAADVAAALAVERAKARHEAGQVRKLEELERRAVEVQRKRHSIALKLAKREKREAQLRKEFLGALDKQSKSGVHPRKKVEMQVFASPALASARAGKFLTTANPSVVKAASARAGSFIHNMSYRNPLPGAVTLGHFIEATVEEGTKTLVLQSYDGPVFDEADLERVLDSIRDPKYRRSVENCARMFWAETDPDKRKYIGSIFYTLHKAKRIRQREVTAKDLEKGQRVEREARERARSLRADAPSFVPSFILEGAAASKPASTSLEEETPPPSPARIPLPVNTPVGTLNLSVDADRVTDAVWDILSHMATDGVVSSVRGLMGMITCIGSISECPSWRNVILNVGNFIFQHITPVHNPLGQWLFKQLRTLRSSQLEAEDGEQEVEGDSWWENFKNCVKGDAAEAWGATISAFSPVSVVVSSDLGRSLVDLLSLFSVSSVLAHSGVLGDPKVVLGVKKKIEKLLGKDSSTDSLAAYAGRFVKTLLQRMREALETGDISALFARGRSLVDLRAHSNILLNDVAIRMSYGKSTLEFQRRKKAGDYPPFLHSQLTEPARMALMEELLEDVARYEFVAKEKRDVPLGQEMNKLRQDLAAAIMSIRNKGTNSEFRMQPFSLYIAGPAGTGKTTAAEEIFKSIGVFDGLPIAPACLAQMKMGVNFQDTFESHSWCAMFDDVDTAVGQSTYGTPNHCTLLMEVVNRKPLPIEKAAVEDKGKVFANLKLSLYLSNFVNGRLAGFLLPESHPAFWRRFNYHVLYEVREQFANDEGGLDPDRLDGSNDYWRVRVCELDWAVWDRKNVERSPPPFSPVYHPKAVDGWFEDKSALLTFFRQAYREHCVREEELLTKRAADQLCPGCGLVHGWDPETEQMQKCESALALDGYGPAALTAYALPKPTTVNIRGRDFPAWVPYDPYEGTYVDNTWVIDRRWREEAQEVVRNQAVLEYAAERARQGLPDLTDEEVAALTPEKLDIWSHGVYRVEGIKTKLFFRAMGAVLGTVSWYPWSDSGDNMVETLISAGAEHAGLDPYDDYYLQAVGKFAHVAFTVLTYVDLFVCVVSMFRAESTEGYGLEVGGQPFDYGKTTNWDRVPVSQVPLSSWKGSPCVSQEQLALTFQKRTARVRCAGMEVNGVFVEKNFLLTVRHAFLVPGDDTRSKIPDPTMYSILMPVAGEDGTWVQSRAVFTSTPELARTAVCYPGKDLVLLYVQEVPPTFSSVVEQFASADVSGSMSVLDEVTLVHRRDVVRAAKGKILRAGLNPGTNLSGVSIEGSYPSEVGACGSVILGRAGKYHAPLGVHVGRFKNLLSSTARGEFVSARDLKWLIEELTLNSPIRKLQCAPVQSLMPWAISSTPAKSSLRVAAGTSRIPLLCAGTVGLGATKMKTKVVDTLFKGDFGELIEELCGTGTYEAPIFKGKMEDGKWRDPVVVHLEKIENGYMHEGALSLAVTDYLRGGENLPGWDRCRVLTDYEAWRGVFGTAISPMKLSTSAGAPQFRPKREFIKFDDDKKEVLVHPDVSRQIEDVKELLKAGVAPMPFCMASKKDEVVSATKNAQHAIRIFMTCPAAWNFLVRKYLAPLSTMMKANREFFEMALGINMTSANEVEWLVNLLHRFNTLVDEDYSGFDLTQCFDILMKFVDPVVRQMCAWAHYSEEETFFATLLFASCVFTVRCYNGDLMLAASMNPSGNAWTVEINCLSNSGLERYAFFFLLLEKGFSMSELSSVEFRMFVALVTFGDDLAKSISDKVKSWYTSEEKARVLAKSGFKVVPGSKEGGFVTFPSVEGLSFLKRGFRREQGTWRCPLAKKTLGKMLALRMEGTLSVIDHHALILSNFLRESFLHGREFYERMAAQVKRVALKHGLFESTYMQVGDYDVWAAEYSAGLFVSWEINLAEEDVVLERVPVPSCVMVGDMPLVTAPVVGDPQEEEGCFSLEMSEIMNSVNQSHVTVTDPNIATALGEMRLSGDVEVVTQRSAEKPLGPQAPPVSLDAYLGGNVLIATYSLTGTDVQFADIANNMSPWYNWLSNAQIAAKIAGMTMIRGDLAVTVHVDCPPSVSGLYLASCVCDGTPSSATMVPAAHNAYQAIQAPSAFLNLTHGNSVEINLPYVSGKEYMSTSPSASGNNMWRFNLWCFTPISNVFSTDAVICTVRVYARLLPGFVLTVPKLQGKKQFPSKADKKVSSGLRAGAELASAAVPFIGEFAAPVAAGLSALGGIAEALGFSRKAAEEKPTSVVRRPWSNLATTSGYDTGEVVALTPGASTSLSLANSGGTDADPCAFGDLFSKWTLVRPLTWSSTDTYGTVLLSIPVSPCYMGNVLGTLYPGPAAYVGMTFQFWRGSMQYLIYLAASQFHTGSLCISVSPTKVTTFATDPTHQLHNTIIDLTATDRTCVEVGWNSQSPALQTTPMANLAGFPDTAPSNGYLTISVAAPLRGPLTSTSAGVFVFSRAAPDMQFGCPSTGVVISGNAIPLGGAFVLQGGAFEPDSELDVISLVPRGDPYPAGDLLWGETVSSVRPLMQKPSLLGTAELSTTTWSLQLNHYLGGPRAAYDTIAGGESQWSIGPFFTWAGWYGAMFTGLRASARVKIAGSLVEMDTAGVMRPLAVAAGQTGGVVPDFTVGLQYPTSTIGAHHGWQIISGENAAEFTFPPVQWSSSFWSPHRAQAVGSDFTYGIIDLVFPDAPGLPASYLPRVYVYYSLSDDIAVTNFRMVPALQVRP